MKKYDVMKTSLILTEVYSHCIARDNFMHYITEASHGKKFIDGISAPTAV